MIAGEQRGAAIVELLERHPLLRGEILLADEIEERRLRADIADDRLAGAEFGIGIGGIRRQGDALGLSAFDDHLRNRAIVEDLAAVMDEAAHQRMGQSMAAAARRHAVLGREVQEDRKDRHRPHQPAAQHFHAAESRMTEHARLDLLVLEQTVDELEGRHPHPVLRQDRDLLVHGEAGEKGFVRRLHIVAGMDEFRHRRAEEIHDLAIGLRILRRDALPRLVGLGGRAARKQHRVAVPERIEIAVRRARRLSNSRPKRSSSRSMKGGPIWGRSCEACRFSFVPGISTSSVAQKVPNSSRRSNTAVERPAFCR